jgi:enoyl-[acyl-carrier protein] reductase I
MLLESKKILIMGIRNKWSIAFGIAKSAYENGAQLLFTYMGKGIAAASDKRKSGCNRRDRT